MPKEIVYIAFFNLLLLFFIIHHLLTSSSFYSILNFSQATVSVKINNFLIFFYSFDLSFSVLENDNSVENVYFVLSSLIK